MGTEAIRKVERAIDEIRAGRMVILVDDEDRENEGDLIIPAQMATPDVINFMARFGRGLICLAMTSERVGQLGLEPMTRANGTRHGTAFTVSIAAEPPSAAAGTAAVRTVITFLASVACTVWMALPA